MLISENMTLPIIVAIVYMIIEVYKEITYNREKAKRMIPLIALCLGIILSVIGYVFSPEMLPADNILMAIFVGGASGLAATGTNQVFKQLKKQTNNGLDN